MLAEKLAGSVGNASNPIYIEDVFSTYLYTGNGSTQAITNGIDLSGKGGLVWIKSRSAATNHNLFNTAQGTTKLLHSNTTGATVTDANSLTAFNTSGFTLGSGNTTGNQVNTSAATYASWTFRKQPKFFDIATATADASSGIVTINHSLGSTPAFVIVKDTLNADSWYCYHTSLGTSKYIRLNSTDAATTFTNLWAVSSTTVTLNGLINPGDPVVAYLFASNAGGFGLTGTDNVISCGTFTTDASGNATVNLGYEPQWILHKQTDASNWYIIDNMRGFAVTGEGAYLLPNSSAAEGTGAIGLIPTSTGFNAVANAASTTFIYIAIRRGPMKVPTSGTSVFSPNVAVPTASTTLTTNFPSDLTISTNRARSASVSTYTFAGDRLRGTSTTAVNTISPNATDAENPYSGGGFGYANNTAVIDTYWNSLGGTQSSTVWWNFRRAPSFFDEVCYTGTGSAMTVSHNLQAVPEMIIVKNRSNLTAWAVYSPIGPTKVLTLNTTNAETTFSGSWNNTAPTSSVFTVGNSTGTNQSGNSMVAYLFVTCAGVSKVGSYTGNGSTQTINCGFTGGARFVLIKRTDSTGDWYVYDTARGMTTLTDPYLLMNTTTAEVTTTNYVDTDSTGFQVTAAGSTTVNVSGGTYIFLAIA